MKIYLPNDAEGNVIPFDTECLYSYDGKKQDVLRFTYYKKQDKWEIETDLLIIDSTFLHLTPPDSWEKLLDDLGATEDYANTTDNNYLDSPTCIYAHSIGKSCGSCKLYGGTSCTGKMCADIASRIRRLRGEG